MGSSTDNKTQINPLKAIILPTIRPCKTKTTGDDFRNVMLVGAALIATVTFQAGITPPGGVWQSDDNQGHRAGHAVYSDQKVPFQIFLIFNTIALTSSIFLLLCLTFGYPYFLEVLIATVSMMGTYSSGIYCITPYESVSFRLIFVAAPAPLVIRFVIWVVASACSSPSKKISRLIKITITKVMVQNTAPAQYWSWFYFNIRVHHAEFYV